MSDTMNVDTANSRAGSAKPEKVETTITVTFKSGVGAGVSPERKGNLIRSVQEVFGYASEQKDGELILVSGQHDAGVTTILRINSTVEDVLEKLRDHYPDISPAPHYQTHLAMSV